MPALRFPPACRLRKPAEFAAVYRQRRRLRLGPLQVSWCPNGQDTPRLGLAIARKPLASAVVRNRIKRLIRESFRLNQHRLPPVDIAISLSTRQNKRDDSEFQDNELRDALEGLWPCLIERCVASPSA